MATKPTKSIKSKDNNNNDDKGVSLDNLIGKNIVSDALEFIIRQQPSVLIPDLLQGKYNEDIINEAKSVGGTVGRYSTPAIIYRTATGNTPYQNEDVRNEYKQKALVDALNVINILGLFAGGIGKGATSTAGKVSGSKGVQRFLSSLEGKISDIGVRGAVDDVTRIVPKVEEIIDEIPLTELNTGAQRFIRQVIKLPGQENFNYVDEFFPDTIKPATAEALRALREIAETRGLDDAVVNIVRIPRRNILPIISEANEFLKPIIDEKGARIFVDEFGEFALPATKQFATGVQKVIDRIPVPGKELPVPWRFSSGNLDDVTNVINERVLQALLANAERNKALQLLTGATRTGANILDTVNPSLPVIAAGTGLKALMDWLNSREQEPVIDMPSLEEPVFSTIPFPPTTTTTVPRRVGP